ncbi:glycine cleavage system aminomethyltransferase GcvT [Magnetococcales bacterium HHB-1]
MDNLKETTLCAQHKKAGAKLVPYSDWLMPLHYGSQLKEHQWTRKYGSLFDVSHMVVMEITGAEAEALLQRALALDVGTLKPYMARYGLLLNEQGGVEDDLIVYKMPEGFRIIVNCGHGDSDRGQILKSASQIHPPFEGEVKLRSDLAILAIQGPEAIEKAACGPLENVTLKSLKPFTFMMHHTWMIARTGYTGEDGVEIIAPKEEIIPYWDTLLQQGLKPAGLGARDTLRLEAGMHLMGKDMQPNISPLDAGLAWSIAWTPETRHFVGREILEQQKEQRKQDPLKAWRRVGVVLTTRGIPRDGAKIIHQDQEIGLVTSGGFSPTMGIGIALARIRGEAVLNDPVIVQMGGRKLNAKLVKPTFVRHGQIICDRS